MILTSVIEKLNKKSDDKWDYINIILIYVSEVTQLCIMTSLNNDLSTETEVIIKLGLTWYEICMQTKERTQ